MKLIPIIIILAAIAIGTWQRQESARLAERETRVRTRQQAFPAQGGETGSGTQSGPALATKTERIEKRKFNSISYIAKFYKMIAVCLATRKDPGIKEMEFMMDDLVDASPEELMALPSRMRKVMPPGVESDIYAASASRLLDKDPALASEFAVKGADINSFLNVMRIWISRDPAAAGEWLAMKAQADPPLGEKTFPAFASHPEPLDLPSLTFAADLAAAPAHGDLSRLLELEGPELAARLDDVMAVLPPEGLPILLKRMSESGRDDLIEAVLKKHPDPAQAREYLASASLPPDQFLKAATVVVADLDPAGMRHGAAWFIRATDPESRADGLREIVSSWTNQNPRSAEKWIAKLPDGKDREVAAQAYAAAQEAARSTRISGSR